MVLINTVLNSAFVSWMMFSYFRGLAKGARGGRADRRLHAIRRVLQGRRFPPRDPASSPRLCFVRYFAWNDFLYPMFLTRLDSKPISVALLSAYGTKDITWGTLGALAHFSTIPIVLIVLVLNRYFVQGVTKGVH